MSSGPAIRSWTVFKANRPLSTTRLPGARPPRCIPHASAKKGVGTFQFSHNTDALASLQPELTWFYTWSAAKNNVAGDGQGISGNGLEFVPMIWGVDKSPGRHIDDELHRIEGGSTHLLGFNEPDGDRDGQSNVDPITAAHRWPELMNTGKRLGSPATAGRADKSWWMDQFMHEVVNRGLTVDFMCVHWYPSTQTSLTDTDSAAQEVADYITAVHQKWNKPIWLTEFALIDFNHPSPQYPSTQKQVDFLRTAVYKLEHLDFLERYAWFALPNGNDQGENNGLFWGDGSRSEVGTAYKYAHN